MVTKHAEGFASLQVAMVAGGLQWILVGTDTSPSRCVGSAGEGAPVVNAPEAGIPRRRGDDRA